MNNRILLKTIFISLFIFILNSCSYNFFDNFYKVSVPQGSIVTEKMIEKLEVGLTEAQVKYIMGSPTINDGLNPDIWVYIGTLRVGTSYEYNNHLTLYFQDGKLTKWVDRQKDQNSSK